MEEWEDVIFFSFPLPVKLDLKFAASVSSDHTHSTELYATVMHCAALAQRL